MIARLDRGEHICFSESIVLIDALYSFVPVRFINGVGSAAPVINEAGTNKGSCKIFYFARLHGLSPQQTLALFGDYYRLDVLQHPEATDHANIRTFMRYGWEGIHYEGVALVARDSQSDSRLK
ncbi:HopJ type III effector protein [Candidatus Methylospira mobilis]|nr:HopJ type III effector protein [Candidatus Methylospira mobilis]